MFSTKVWRQLTDLNEDEAVEQFMQRRQVERRHFERAAETPDMVGPASRSRSTASGVGGDHEGGRSVASPLTSVPDRRWVVLGVWALVIGGSALSWALLVALARFIATRA